MNLFKDKIKVKKLSPVAKYFVGSEDAAGLDVTYCPAELTNDSELSHYTKTLNPGESYVFGTGLSFEPPKSIYDDIQMSIVVKARSGLSVKNNIEKGAGLIDADYRGEVKIHLYNHGTQPVRFYVGERIAQITFVPCAKVHGNIEEIETLSETERSDGGFGSTGLK